VTWTAPAGASSPAARRAGGRCHSPGRTPCLRRCASTVTGRTTIEPMPGERPRPVEAFGLPQPMRRRAIVELAGRDRPVGDGAGGRGPGRRDRPRGGPGRPPPRAPPEARGRRLDRVRPRRRPVAVSTPDGGGTVGAAGRVGGAPGRPRGGPVYRRAKVR
jgi:hypothetical protein